MFAICVIFSANLEGSRLPYNRNRAVSLKVKDFFLLLVADKGVKVNKNQPKLWLVFIIMLFSCVVYGALTTELQGCSPW